MRLLVISLCVLCQLFLISGQLFFKHAMAPGHAKQSTGRMAWLLSCGIALNAVFFFIWLGLLESNPLTKIFPFEALNPAMMAILAWLVLKERLPPIAWVGLALVCVGIGIVWA